MSFTQERYVGGWILAPRQPRIDGSNAGELEAELLALESAATRVVLDLAEVDYVSSAGLRAIVFASKRLKQRGGSLALCSLRPLVQEVFEVSGLTSLLRIAPDRAAAIEP